MCVCVFILILSHSKVLQEPYVHSHKHTQGSRVTLIPDPSEEQSIDWTPVLFVTGDHSDWDTAQACYPALP